MTPFSNNEYALDMRVKNRGISVICIGIQLEVFKFDLVLYNKESVSNCRSACELIFSDKNN